MIALDTNVLVRLIVDDDLAPQQVSAARRRIHAEDRVLIARCVFLETLWVLERSYGYARTTVAKVALQLLEHPRYLIVDAALLTNAVDLYRDSNIGFADALALVGGRAAGTPLLTFDRKLARLEGAELLSG